MYAVGRLIGRSIGTVSGPFHPFGGAVDIVVVEQRDGSFKSSPWYVRFGKFQGVLKTREKVVSICVNGVEADFHMYLDHKGEAYFLEDVEEEIALDSSSSGESKDELMRSQSCNLDAQESLIVRSDSISSESSVTVAAGSKRGRLLGLVWGRKMSQDEVSPEISRVTSLDRAEIVADLLDVNWSTELATEKPKPLKSSQLSEYSVSSNECSVHEDILADTNVTSSLAAGVFVQEPSGLISQVSQNFAELQIGNAGDDEEKKESFGHNSAEKVLETKPLQLLATTAKEESVNNRQVQQSDGSMLESEVELEKSYERFYSMLNPGGFSSTDDTRDLEWTATIEESCSTAPFEDDRLKNCHTVSRSIDTIHEGEVVESVKAENHDDEQFIFSDDELKPGEDGKTSVSASSSMDKEMDSLALVDDTHLRSHVSLTSLEEGLQVEAQKKFEDLLDEEQQKTFFPIDINEFQDANTDIDERMVESLPNLWSHIDSLEADHHPRHSFDASTTSPRWLSLRSNISSLKKPVVVIEPDLDKSQLSVTDDAPSETPKSDLDLDKSQLTVTDGTPSETPKSDSDVDKSQRTVIDDAPSETPKSDSVSSGVGNPSKTIVVPSGTWRLWPFSFQRASSSKSTTSSVNPSSEVSDHADMNRPIESISAAKETKPLAKHKVIKKKMRTITPTSAQLASLGLNAGGNIITFTFSTAMLGKQQVDARIYLWKWNERIVISDVDGTITRSDVLGQFMPMVGYDWNHIGVAHFFSAIKENGYQLLYLSARSISQSHLTRQFIFNLKQGGKTLPDGPVVISPDGLFPSLFREVIRRAPHEFKIACLEDIKALYPPDVSPFYAGFGNRDTDEISYLRVGIPEGKIYIINPKGEVAVHRRVDTNSYGDLHALVDGMFPVVSSPEQEAYNSWNFWKLPPRMDFKI